MLRLFCQIQRCLRKIRAHTDPEADWMPEWNVKIDGAPDGANSDFYRMQVCILRESTSVMTNIVLSLAVIMLLSFTSYGIEIDDFQDRVQVNVTLLLATMTFKFVLGNSFFSYFSPFCTSHKHSHIQYS